MADHFDAGSGSDNDWEPTVTEIIDGVEVQSSNKAPSSSDLLTLRQSYKALRTPIQLEQLHVKAVYRGRLTKEVAVYLHTLLFTEYLPLLIGMIVYQEDEALQQLIGTTTTSNKKKRNPTEEARAILEELASICPLVQDDDKPAADGGTNTTTNSSNNMKSLAAEDVVTLLQAKTVTTSEISDLLVMLEGEIYRSINLMLHTIGMNSIISNQLLKNYLYPCFYPLLCSKEVGQRSSFHFRAYTGAFICFHRFRAGKSIQSSISLPSEPLLKAFTFSFQEDPRDVGAIVGQAAMVASYHFQEEDGSGTMLRRHWSYFAPLFVHKGAISTTTLTTAFLSFVPKFECVRTEAQRTVAIEILDELFSMVATAASPTAAICAAAVLPRFIILLSGGSITARSSKNLLDRNHSISLYRAHAGKLDLSSYAERCFTFATRAVGIRNQYVTTAAAGDIKSTKASVTKNQAQDWGRAIAYLLTPDINTPMWAHLRRFARVAETYMGTHTTKNSQQTTVIKFVTQIIKEVAFRAQIQVQLQRLEQESTTTTPSATTPILGLILPQAAYDSLVFLFINAAISANNLEMLVKLSFLSPAAARPRMEKLVADAIGGDSQSTTTADQGGDSSSQAQQVLPLMQLVAITCLREVANSITSCQINDDERVAIVASLRSYFPWLRQQITVYSGRLTEQSLLTLSDTISFVPLSDFLPTPSCQIEYALEVTKATYNRLRDAPSEEGRGFKSFASTMSSLSQPALCAVGEYLISELTRHESFKSAVEVYYLPRVAALIEDGRYILDKYIPIVASIAADPHSRAERVSMHTTILALVTLATRCGDYEGHRNAIMDNETLIFDIIRNFGARYTSNTHHVESLEFGVRVMRGLVHVAPIIPTLTDRLHETTLGGDSEGGEGGNGTTNNNINAPFHLFKESSISKHVVHHSNPSDAHIACAMRLYKKMKNLFVYDIVRSAGVACFEDSDDAESTATNHHVDPTIQQVESTSADGFAAAAIMARKRRDAFVGDTVPLDHNQEEPYTATVTRKYCVCAIRQLAAVGAWLHSMKNGFSNITPTTTEESLAALDTTLSKQLAFSTNLLQSRSPIRTNNNKAPPAVMITHNAMEVYGTVIEYNLAPIYTTPYVHRDEASQVPPHWSADMKLSLRLTREILKDDPSFAHRGFEAVGSLLRGSSKSRWEDDVEFEPRRKNYLGGTEPIISILQLHIDAVRHNNAVEGDSMKAFSLYIDMLEDNDNEDGVSTTASTTTVQSEIDMCGVAANQKLWGEAASAELLLLPTSLTSSSVDQEVSSAEGVSGEQLTVQHAERMEILTPILSLLQRWCDRLMMPQCADAAMLVLGTISAMVPLSVTSLFITLMIEKFSATCPMDFADDSGAEGRKVEALLLMLGYRAKIHQKIPISPAEEAALWRFASREFKSQPRVQNAADALMSSLAIHHQPRPSSIQKANLAALYTLLQRDHIITADAGGSSSSSTAAAVVALAAKQQSSSSVTATSSLAAKHIRRLIRRTACTLNLAGTMRLVSRDLSTLMGLLVHKEFGPSIQASLIEVTLSMDRKSMVGAGSVTFKKNGDAEDENNDNNTIMEVPFEGSAHYSRFQALAPKGAFGATVLKYSVFARTTLPLDELSGGSSNPSLSATHAPQFAGVFRSAEECTEWFVSLMRRVSVGDFKSSLDIVEFIRVLIRCDNIIHLEEQQDTTTSLLQCLFEGIETYFTEWVGLVSGSSRSQVSASDLPYSLLCDALYHIHLQHEQEKQVAIHHYSDKEAQKNELERSERVFTKFWDMGLKQLHTMINVLSTNVSIPKDVFFSATPNGVLGHLAAFSERETSICAPILEQIGYLVRHGSGGNNNNNTSTPAGSESETSSGALDVRVLQRYLHFWNSCLSDAPFPRQSMEESITRFLTVTLPVPVLSNLFSDPGIRHVTDHIATAFRSCTACADQEATPYCAKRPPASTSTSSPPNPASIITGPATPHISLVCGQAPPVTLVVRNYLANLMRHTLELQERANIDTASAATTLLSPVSPASDVSVDTTTAPIIDSVIMKQALLLTAFTASMLATARSLLTNQLESQVVPMIVSSMKWIPHHNARDAVECFNTMSGVARKLLSAYLPKDIVTSVLSDLCRRLLGEATTEGSGSSVAAVAKSPTSPEDDTSSPSTISAETEAMASSSVALSSHSNSKNRLMILFIESIQALLVHNVHRLGKFSTFEEVFNAITAVLGAGGQTAQHNHNNAAKNAIASLVRFSSDEQVSALVQPSIVALREGKRRALAASTPSERTAASTRPERKAVHVISAVVLAYPEQMPNFCAKSLLALGPFTNHWHSEARNAAQFTFKNWWKTHRSRWDLEFKKTLSKDTVERLEEYFAGATYFV